MKTAREFAVEALCRVEKDDAWSNLALASVLDAEPIPVQERGFASALFYDTLVHRYTIDSTIAGYSKMPLRKMDVVIRNILRTAFCQLLFFDSVPEHAAVDEAVNLCKKMRKSSAAGFANGILRTFLREGKRLPTGKKTLDQLALRYSCPPEWVALWQKVYGEDETLRLLKESLLAPPVFLRVNPLKTTAEKLVIQLLEQGISGELVPKMPHCIKVKSKGALQQDELYQQGYFHIQDLSSQLAVLSLGAKKGEQILDLCAAPGGKTLVLAQEMADTGEIVACDIYPQRVEEIKLRAARLGLQSITAMTLDMTLPHPELGEFDRVLCDVPCSGLGTIRRRPEIKYQLPQNFETLPELQMKLLVAGSNYCKKGGILVYSTCTLSPLENQQIAAKFLQEHPEFTPANAENPLFSDYEKTIFIGDQGGDGFFVAVFKRQ